MKDISLAYDKFVEATWDAMNEEQEEDQEIDWRDFDLDEYYEYVRRSY